MNPENPTPAVPGARFETAIRRFDEENAHDPNTTFADGRSWPRELLYAHRMSNWVQKLCPEASEALRLAARCQHICRWSIPRSQFPMTRAGYLKWRTELKQFHARKAREILTEIGYPEVAIAQVEALNLKQLFPDDPESRVLEDALCLIFLEYQLAELAPRSTEDKMINALRKSWDKMTPIAREIALKLPLGPAEKKLVEKALGGGLGDAQ